MRQIALTLMALSLSGCLVTRANLREEQNQQQINVLQKAKADSDAHYDEINANLRATNGRIEVVEHDLQKTRSEFQNDPYKKSTDEKLKAYQESLIQLQKQVEALAAEIENMKAAKAAAVAKSEAANKDLFGAAEASFNDKQWKEAIYSYEKYRKANPNGKNYSVATYKIGACFEELGKGDEAKLLYKEVLERFPKSQSAKKAKYRLSQLKD